ncbi:hypothetical protein GCM10027565_28200 [Bordetella tumulicola]
MNTTVPDLAQLDAQALREFAADLMAQLSERDRELKYHQTRIDQLTHEMAMLKRYQFGKRSEQLDGTQSSLLGEMIDADMAEKLDYMPGVFTVERHVRGKWVCATCETLVQAPVPAQVIDKGISTSGLLPRVLMAKYADYRKRPANTP